MKRYFFAAALLILGMLPNLAYQPARAAPGQPANWTDLGIDPSGDLITNLLPLADGTLIGTLHGGTTPAIFSYNEYTGLGTKVPVTIPGGYTSRLVKVGNLVYITTAQTFGLGYLVSYNPATGEQRNLGALTDEYGQAVATDANDNIYIATCCKGHLSIFNTHCQSWTHKNEVLPGYGNISALENGQDGYIYGVASYLNISPITGATLFKINIATQVATVVGVIWPGVTVRII